MASTKRPKWPKNAIGTKIPMFYGTVILVTAAQDYIDATRYMGCEPDDVSASAGITQSMRGTKDGDRVYLVGVFDGNITTLIHELAHAVFSLHDDLGMPVKEGEANESFAYIQGWLFDELAGYVDERFAKGRSQKALWEKPEQPAESKKVAELAKAITPAEGKSVLDNVKDDDIVFMVAFYYDENKELCCAANGDLSSRQQNIGMARALVRVAEHITDDEDPPAGETIH